MNHDDDGDPAEGAGPEAAFLWLEEIRTWADNGWSDEALRGFAADWPKARDMALEEAMEQIQNPTGSLSQSQLPLAAFHLAAAFRDPLFIPPLLGWIFMEDGVREWMCGDILVNAGPSLLALMASRSQEGILILELAATELPGTDALHQMLVVDALALLLRDGLYERERFDQVIRLLAEQIDFDLRHLSEEPWCDWLALALMQAGVGEFEYEIRRWHRKGMMFDGTPRIFDMKEFEKSLAEHPDGQPDETFLRLYREIPQDPSKCMDWLRAMEKSHEKVEAWPDDEEELPSDALLWDDDPTMPLVRVEPKIGRNDPCPCGSGKKYKKCCGAN